ncbi:serine protein kinase [Aspergillus flavus]|uniref:Serine protein kinase n=1 Tax=Aspergillus flavus (strain ATCC 200026 / FGSC A1120 / IAM 13836 / NRRL 3357 / JCM 12722 / SRRC 167) TaxID=332952 RepID=A0A7G5KJA0_ASPFN|nr:uncharacterized protein G4B84_011409 [Aspergillus flavus NRRL3357]KAJ1704835.1 serine protein kinase [Aspergillus flavus]KAF7629508.1 hypothetical protein AFLA_013222 [Aspergillus flavus NRRL3357]QMW35880.1 hypothetical protein G4B84_011409 [Aspergillus flavus NRRL3357]QMW47942.1 hypothetical protein G4B11_011460 [Aspergillus flavus]QRD93187.1 serine protein kinase [Aspergillus flavus]
MAPILPDNNYAYHSNAKVTIILSTGKYTIDDKFKFSTNACLIYAETIHIASSIKAPGQSIGLFCHTLTTPSRVTINVSGDEGRAGANGVDKDGGKGGDGQNAGNVWICVQSLPRENTFLNLEIKAYGGSGGRGGDSTSSQYDANKTKGGDGGNGGNGGDIELLFGTAVMDAARALVEIQKRPWPEQALCLTEPILSDSLPGYLSQEDTQLLGPLKSLHSVLRAIVRQLKILSGAGDSKEIQDTASSLIREVDTDLAANDKAPKNVTTDTFKSLQGILESIRSLNQKTPNLNATDILANAKKAIGTVVPQNDSKMISITENLQNTLLRTILDIETSVYDIAKFNSRGAAGFGGIGGIGSQNGASGKAGQKDGRSRARNLHFQGTKRDADVWQAYIFPEQCQMLLNKADDLFFSSNTDDWKSANTIYNTLLARLQVLHDQGNSSSGLFSALEHLETELNVTYNPIEQLRLVYEQAISRRNRLLLGQDMFGHVDSWVPRLSFGFYAQSVEQRFEVLKSAEYLTAEYEEAFQKNNDLRTTVEKGISKMLDAQKEAEAKIDLLTSSNGPLVTGIYKISSLTKEVKTKRQLLTKKLTNIQFAAKQFDWTILLDAASTLVSLRADPKSIVDTVKQGYEIYKKVTDESTAKNLHGDAVKKEYIIDQLAQCSDTLESLEKAFTTRKDNQIEIDDPGALKIMATKGNIQKILREFKNAIVEKDKKDIESALDDYIAVTLNRNNAVLDYNSSLQLLFEASNAREYSKSQAESLGQRRHTLDPNTPAILFWLRKTRDNMRLQLMQRLNYESRAIRFWGLKKHLDYSSPGPLRSFIELRDGQSKLNAAYEDSLNSYANNIRVTWPREEKEKGLFYILSNAELKAFKQRQRLTTSKGDDGVYSASIRLEPGAPPFGPGRADVRINQVRLWLLGVEVKADNAGRKQLMVKIAHSGNETLENTDRQALGFSHDAVNIQFEYNTAKVQTSDDFKTDVVFGKQGLENDWSGGDSKPTASTFAAIGPFTEWRFSIRESENVGLDMRSVTAAYVEFRGANRPFSVDYRKA